MSLVQAFNIMAFIFLSSEGGSEDDTLLLTEVIPETEVELALRQMYTSKAAAPRFVDSGVRFQEIRGRGRGLVATTPLELGRLLLVSAPLGIVYCEEGSTPENEELAEHMMAR